MKTRKKEKIINILIIELAVFIMGKLFYGSFLGGIILTPLSIFLYKERQKQIRAKKRMALETQFKDMLISISDSLKTGYSIESAIKESYKDMCSIYGKESDICKEVQIMISQIKLNIGTEKVIWDFSKRIRLKNARLFASIFQVAKKTGGNVTEVIKSVTDDIVLKEEAKEEIDTSITEKRLEQKVMTVIPMFIIFYVTVSSPGFLDIMYESILGKIIMSVCIGAYICAYIWGERIIQSITKE